MATVAQFDEWAGLRDEILKVFNRRRRSFLKKIKKCQRRLSVQVFHGGETRRE